MGYVMSYIGLITIAILVWKMWKEDTREAWENGFKAGRDCGTITVTYEKKEEE